MADAKKPTKTTKTTRASTKSTKSDTPGTASAGKTDTSDTSDDLPTTASAAPKSDATASDAKTSVSGNADTTPAAKDDPSPAHDGDASTDPDIPASSQSSDKLVKPETQKALGKTPGDDTASAATSGIAASGIPKSGKSPASAQGPRDSTVSDSTSTPTGPTDPSVSTSSDSRATPATQTTPARRGGFFGMVLGGIIAAAIGFAAALYTDPATWPFRGGDTDRDAELQATLSEQDARIAELSERLTALSDSAAADDSAQRFEALGQRLDTTDGGLAGLTQTLQDLDQRLVALEKRPISEGVSEEAIAAYERELQNLQDRMADQRAEVEALTRQAESDRAAAEETAAETTVRAALTQVRAAMESGAAFQSALDTLDAQGVDVPADLARAADGVATLAQLQVAFPDPARAALDASRGTAADGSLGGFLRQQLGARSLTARDGTDPDAVLSRAEAALREGRLGDALAEIDSLPEPAQAELSEWRDRAAKRHQALTAADALSQQLNLK